MFGGEPCATDAPSRSSAAPASALRPSPDFVRAPTDTWVDAGSIETEVDVAELRSVRDELLGPGGGVVRRVGSSRGVLGRRRLRRVRALGLDGAGVAAATAAGDPEATGRVAAGTSAVLRCRRVWRSVILETRGPPEERRLFVKRVVAVAGDELEIVTRGAVPARSRTPRGTPVPGDSARRTPRRTRRGRLAAFVPGPENAPVTAKLAFPRSVSSRERFRLGDTRWKRGWTLWGYLRSKTCAGGGSGSPLNVRALEAPVPF